MDLFKYKYRLKFQMAKNDVSFLYQHKTFKNRGGGGGGSLDYVILLSLGGGLDYGGGKNDNVLCERPLSALL